MTTLTQTHSSLRLLWQTLRLSSRHFLPLFTIGGLPWALFALIPILLGQEHSFADLQRAQVPLSWELLYPFAWAVLYGAVFFPLVNGALVHATGQALEHSPVRIIAAYRAALPRWSQLGVLYLLFGVFCLVLGLVLSLPLGWCLNIHWQGPGDVLLTLAGNLGGFYYVMLMHFYPQILVLEGESLLPAWTRNRQVLGRAGKPLVGVLLPLLLLGAVLRLMWLPEVGRWAEVLGAGLTNLLCLVGVTVVFWEAWVKREPNEDYQPQPLARSTP
jgi:hypothetical protein